MANVSSEADDFQRSTRMPLDAVVRLHFEGTVAYQNGFAANVSASGMFVKHPEPPPIGTRLVFEFAVGSQRRPVQGGGDVVWVREKYEGPGRPAGAGIRFRELDDLSRQHVTEALFEFLEASLGDRLGESAEARALVASMPTHAAPAELEPEPAAAPAAVVTEELLPPLPPMPPMPPVAAGSPPPGATPFRIFDDDTPLPELTFGTNPIPGPQLAGRSTAAAPPPAAAIAGAASAREDRRSRLMPLVIVLVLLAALGAAAWWQLYRTPPAGPAPEPAAAAASAEPPPPPPAPPPLDARPGPDRTLIETVGAPSAAPEIPIPAPAPEPPVAEPEPEPAPAADTEPPATPTPRSVAPAPPEPAAPAVARARAVRAIDAAATGGGTVITIQGDGAIPAGAFTWSELGGDKPRVLIKLKGIEQPFRATPRGVPTAEVAGVRTGYHLRSGGNELHVVLDLVPGAALAVADPEPVADGLRVTLRRR